MIFRHYLFIIYIASILCAQDSTLAVNEGEKKDIIYLKDGTFLECDKIRKGAYIWEPSFPFISLYIGCGDKTIEYETIKKIIYADGSTKFEGELINKSKKIKFWYYTATTSIIIALVLLTT